MAGPLAAIIMGVLFIIFRPTVVADPDGDVAGIYKAVARKVAVSIAAKNKAFSSEFPTITISKNT